MQKTPNRAVWLRRASCLRKLSTAHYLVLRRSKHIRILKIYNMKVQILTVLIQQCNYKCLRKYYMVRIYCQNTKRKESPVVYKFMKVSINVKINCMLIAISLHHNIKKTRGIYKPIAMLPLISPYSVNLCNFDRVAINIITGQVETFSIIFFRSFTETLCC